MQEPNIISLQKEVDCIEKQVGDEKNFYKVGSMGVTRITVFYENGQMGKVPWFRVYKGEEVYAELDATNCVVIYKQKDKE